MPLDKHRGIITLHPQLDILPAQPLQLRAGEVADLRVPDGLTRGWLVALASPPLPRRLSGNRDGRRSCARGTSAVLVGRSAFLRHGPSRHRLETVPAQTGDMSNGTTRTAWTASGVPEVELGS
jgi:hypothetical protein